MEWKFVRPIIKPKWSPGGWHAVSLEGTILKKVMRWTFVYWAHPPPPSDPRVLVDDGSLAVGNTHVRQTYRPKFHCFRKWNYRISQFSKLSVYFIRHRKVHVAGKVDLYANAAWSNLHAGSARYRRESIHYSMIHISASVSCTLGQ